MIIKPVSILAAGPLEIIIGSGELRINSLSGPLVHIFNARHLVLHYLDYDETEIFGDTSQPRSQ